MKNKLLWKIHNWIGLYSGVVIVFLSITGAAALFRPEIDRALNPKLTKVVPQEKKASLTKVVEVILSEHPDKYLFEIELPKPYLDTWNIRLMPKEKKALFPMIWEVFVNPHTGEILGERNYFESFSYFLRNIHVRLYEAAYGRQIVGLAGLALLISTITGFLIYGQFMKKRSFGEVRKKNLRIQQADLHKYIGIAALLFNLMISITGAWLGLQVYLMDAFDMNIPSQYVRENKPLGKEQDTAFALDFDKAYSTSKSVFPEMTPWIIRPTTNGEGLIHIYGDISGQTYERRSNKLVLDKFSYATEQKYNISDQDFGAKLYYVQEAFHFGDFAGLPLKVLYCILAFSSGFLSLSGFIIYLERIKKKREKKENQTPLKPLLVKWTVGMLAFIVIIAVLSTNFGIGVPSLLVTISIYGFLLFMILKGLYKLVRKKNM
ncbi:PepSY domain-containing protein [Echinicola sp. 20G]|uniref:PepSY-associated TM helix domain-containing protein n=1 Tax=Echinicola sp. 20G TaxID=2781961 RepID=UPI00190FD284|nr:PepSY-associated TM helix domain-containing protein [Echinicola sp. 20G]